MSARMMLSFRTCASAEGRGLAGIHLNFRHPSQLSAALSKGRCGAALHRSRCSASLASRFRETRGARREGRDARGDLGAEEGGLGARDARAGLLVGRRELLPDEGAREDQRLARAGRRLTLALRRGGGVTFALLKGGCLTVLILFDCFNPRKRGAAPGRRRGAWRLGPGRAPGSGRGCSCPETLGFHDYE